MPNLLHIPELCKASTDLRKKSILGILCVMPVTGSLHHPCRRRSLHSSAWPSAPGVVGSGAAGGKALIGPVAGNRATTIYRARQHEDATYWPKHFLKNATILRAASGVSGMSGRPK